LLRSESAQVVDVVEDERPTLMGKQARIGRRVFHHRSTGAHVEAALQGETSSVVSTCDPQAYFS
jgi:hypothetical protein